MNMAHRLCLLLTLFCLSLAVCHAAPAFAQSPTSSEEAIRKQLREIQNREEFRASNKMRSQKVQEATDWIRKQWDTFLKWLKKLFSESVFQSKSPAIQWLFIGAFLLFGARILARLFKLARKQRPKPSPHAFSEFSPEDRIDGLMSVAEWERRAEEALKAGEYRNAYRALFHAALMQLHERGVVRFERHRTNGEFLRHTWEQSQEALASTLRPIIGDFDAQWYGDQEIGKADADAAQKRYQQIRDQVTHLPDRVAQGEIP